MMLTDTLILHLLEELTESGADAIRVPFIDMNHDEVTIRLFKREDLLSMMEVLTPIQ